jgi:cyclic beta-1,2-glucan synthetase
VSVFGYVEWRLGPPRSGEQRFVVTDVDSPTGRFSRRTPTTADYAGTLSFFRASDVRRRRTPPTRRVRGPRTARSRAPAALFPRAALKPAGGAGMDPVRGAAGRRGARAPARRGSVVFSAGARERDHAQGRDDSPSSYGSVRRRSVASRERRTDVWDDCLGGCRCARRTIRFDLLTNRCSCISAELPDLGAQRSLSAGGAFGFRDQLQDVLALLYARPELCRATCSRRRHGSSSRATCSTGGIRRAGAGPRTRCSDDLLWLPYSCRRYRRVATGTVGARRVVPFLEAPRLDPHQDEAICCRQVSTQSASLFEHCVRAIRTR